MKIDVRPAEARDERRWRELFNGYCLFYERKPDEALNTYTWRRIMDPNVPVYAIVAEKDGAVIGIANYLLHEHTLGLTPACYLGAAALGAGASGRRDPRRLGFVGSIRRARRDLPTHLHRVDSRRRAVGRA